jgi:penicillin-binding protein 2
MSKDFTRRAFLLLALKSISLLFLGCNFYRIQILFGSKYQLLSDKNRIRVNWIQPQRGLIRDRNNKPLVANAFSYQAYLLEDNLDQLNKILEKVDFLPKISNNKKKGDLLLASNLTWQEVVKIESDLYLHQVISIREYYKRLYLYDKLLGYITGYLGLPDKKLDQILVGKNGIEMTYDQELRGKFGLERIEVNALGKKVRELDEEPSKEGSNIKLSLDITLQARLSSLSQEAIQIVLDIKTGGILALLSPPGYDPNIFTDGLSNKAWDDLIQSPEKPLINRAIASLYPPGSTFKMVTLLAILSSGIEAKESVFCSGEMKIGNRTLHCWRRGGHGYINAYNSLEHSCNIYFVTQAMKAGMESINKVSRQLGFGEKTGIELPFEASGFIPTKEWKKDKYKKNWTPGDTANLAIGQGYSLATPLQLTVMTALLASGKKIKPSLLFDNEQKFSKLSRIREADLDLVRFGLYNVMRQHHNNPMEIAGKTGTAQVISKRDGQGKFKEHSIFVGFAPYHDPRFAITTLVENAGWGRDKALPLTKEAFKIVFDLIT